GHQPVVFDDMSQGHTWAVKWGPLERGSLLDPRRLDEVFASRSIDAVVHFAANAIVGESMKNPATYFRNNTAGTLNLLDAMRTARDRRCRCSEPTTPRRTARPCVTTSTWWTSPTRICGRSIGSSPGHRARRSTSGPGGGDSVRDVVNTVARVSGRTVPVVESV